MIIEVGVGDLWMHAEVFDLTNGQVISDVILLDTESETLEMLVKPEPGDIQIQTRTERRRFRVVDTRTGEDVCRTGSDPWAMIKEMIG